MSRRVVLCEGFDDLRVLHEVFERNLRMRVASPSRRRNERFFTSVAPGAAPQEVVVVFPARGGGGEGKSGLPQLMREHLLESQVDDETDKIGLVFDPDDDSDEQVRTWLEGSVLAGLNATRQPSGSYRVPSATRTIEVVPLPWDHLHPFDQLPPEKRCCEQAALAIMQAAAPAEAALVDQMLTLLRAHDPKKATWKAAFRLWNAVRKPNAEDGFYAQVFGQDKDLRPHVEPALKVTGFFAKLESMVT